MRSILTVVAFLALAAPAAAQNGKIVTSTGGFDLYARHGKGAKVCISMLGPSDYSSTGPCAAPVSPFHPVGGHSFSRNVPIAMVLPANVTRATAGDISADTIADESFPRARFLLLSGASPGALLRFYDAGGALVGAAEPDLYDRDRTGQVVFHAPGARIRLRRASVLEPSPLQFDRTAPETCLSVSVSRSGTDACTLDRDLGVFDVDVADGCAPAQGVLYGLVGPRVRRVEALLGSGRRLRVRTAALAAGPARLLAVSVPRGEAVRSVRALGAPGRKRIGAAPSGYPCDDGADSNFLIAYGSDFVSAGNEPLTTGVTVAEAGGRSLRVADGSGATLCTGLGKRLGCAIPPVDAYYTGLDRAGRVVAGVVARDVARVDFRLDGGDVVQAPVTDGAAYAGRYAGKVRFIALELPAGASVKRAVARDADGYSLGEVFAETFHEHATRRPVSPGLTLERTRYSVGDRLRTYSCLVPRHPQASYVQLGVCDYFPSISARAVVDCSPRLALVYGRLGRGARGVRLLLDDGTRLRPRVRRFRGLGRVWTAVLPRRIGMRAVLYRGKRGRRAFRVPPASRQCGYEDQFDAYDDGTRNATLRAGELRPSLNARTVAR